MSRESLRDEPLLDEEIVEQNFELMDERFPEMLMEEWNENIVPVIKEVLANHKDMDDKSLSEKTHKSAGSALQLGANQLGQALRVVSHMVKDGNRDEALGILEDIPEYLEAFEKAVAESE